MTPYKYIQKLMVSGLIIALMNCTLLYNPPEQVISNDTEIAYGTYDDNQTETVYEFITEEWMDLEDCVPDQNNGHDSDGQWKLKTYNYLSGVAYVADARLFASRPPVYAGYIQPLIVPFEKSPATPPPDVV